MINLIVSRSLASSHFISLRSCLFQNTLRKPTYIHGRTAHKKPYSTTIGEGGGGAQNSNARNPAAAEHEALINELNQKLAENKIKNILIYTNPKGGSLPVNLIGCIGGIMLMATSWSSWLLLSSARFRRRNIENENWFMKSVLQMIGSEFFKISLCSIIVLVGNEKFNYFIF